MERFAHLSVNWCFSASIGSFQGLPAGTSEVILLSQRLALKYNTTPPDDCQHFLTSFFQFLCGRVNSLSQSLTALPAPSEREPLARPESLQLKREVACPGIPLPSCRCASSHLPQGDGFSNGDKVSGIAIRRPPWGSWLRPKGAA